MNNRLPETSNAHLLTGSGEGLAAVPRLPEARAVDRRRFLAAGAAAFAYGALGTRAEVAFAAAPEGGADAARYRNLLVLVELKGGNDGLNTVVPVGDPAYARLRPKLAIARDDAIRLSDRAALHPALAPLLPAWERRELAILQGVGYPEPNLSHFRSIEIWETASRSDEMLADGWLARTFARRPAPASFAADGVVIGDNDLGPLAGGGARAIALADPEQFLRRARLASPAGERRNPALAHILKIEGDVVQAASHLDGRHAYATAFPATPFGNAVKTAARVIANDAGVAVVHLSIGSFDTHANQAPTQARLLGDLAQGLAALESALREIGRWDRTLVLTYAEFGRRPKENQSAGTDHGTASVHFALGGKVAGGFAGEAPRLDRVGDGNLPHAIDFRSVYATVLERWWSTDARSVLGGRFETLPILRG
ncbi:MAG: DUF1501 domain-containing protein [Betaproteobacteria bacterium]|nr:DUF1501 domain-containing protein [Betaproteobacteria bacterium]